MYSGRSSGALPFALLAAFALTAPLPAEAKPGSRPGTKGNYTLSFAGDFRGTGTAKINPVHLNVDANLTTASGASVTLKIKNLKLDDGKFLGTGTLDGQDVQVSGRVDGPEGGIVTFARLSLIFKTDAGLVCRGFGEIDH